MGGGSEDHVWQNQGDAAGTARETGEDGHAGRMGPYYDSSRHVQLHRSDREAGRDTEGEVARLHGEFNLRACQQPKFKEVDVRVLLIAFACRPKTVASQWPALTPTISITLLKLSIALSERRRECIKYLTSRDETNTLDVKERESHWGMETRFKRVGIPQDISEDA